MAVDTWDEANEAREIGLTRTRSVLTFDKLTAGEAPGGLFFHEIDEDFPNGTTRNEDRPVVELPPEMWRDLGNPETITIAIWPGDRQDLMESEDFPV